MKHPILLIVFMLAAAQAGWSQPKFTLSGYVSDQRTGERLPFVNVFTNQLGVTTNTYGFYSITLPAGKHEINFSFVGYELAVKPILLTGDLNLPIELKEKAGQLEEVVIQSSRDERVQGMEISKNQLTGKMLKQIPVVFGEPDLVRSLNLMPGVTTVNEAASGFNVRGGAADQNLVMLDEAIVYNTSHAFGFFSVFNPDAIKDFTLYKGGMGAQFGGRVSSVLDVRQKEGNNKSFEGAGSVGTVAARLTLEGPLGKKDSTGNAPASWMISARRSYADLFLRLGLAPDLKDVTLYFYDLNTKANYQLTRKDRVFLSGYFGRDRFAYPGFFGTGWGNATGTLRWNHLFNPKLFSNTTVAYSNYDYTLTNFEASNGFDWDSEINNWNTKTDFTWFANDRHTLMFGALALHYTFQPGRITPAAGSAVQRETFQPKYGWELAAYVSDEYIVNKRLTIGYGIRYARFLRTGNETLRLYANNQPNILIPETSQYRTGTVVGEKTYSSGEIIEAFDGCEPRLNIRWSVSDQSSLKASYNRNFQYISLISSTTSATPLDIWMPSGPYLKPQRGDQWAIGYFQNLKNRMFEISVEGFYKKSENLPDFVDGANLLFNDFIETEIVAGSGRAYGFEAMLKKETGRLTGWVSYTFSRSLRQVAGINNGAQYASNYDRPHQLTLIGNYKINSRWSVASNFVLSSGTPITYPEGKYDYEGLVVPSYSLRNQDRLPTYHRLDISATLHGKRGNWILGIYNVYNRLNPATIYFRERINVSDTGIEKTGKTEAVKFGYFGIIPSVTYEFKF